MYLSKHSFRRPVLAGVMLMLIASNAHAFGNACKNVNLSVDNENDYGVLAVRSEEVVHPV
jgi:hypothetical protein